jgi:hypothetical protein
MIKRTLSAALLSLSIATVSQGSELNSTVQRMLGIPNSIASVVDSHLGAETIHPDVILIQDVHRHPEVQGHIAAILLYGRHHWGLQDVYVEGAQSGASPLPITHLETKDVRRGVYAGELGGAEMAAALSTRAPLQLHGLEDGDLYRKHVQAYETMQRLRKPALRELSTNLILEKGFDLDRTDQKASRYAILQKLLKLRLKSSEYASYLQHPWESRAQSALWQGQRAAEEFYQLADERSRVFTDVITESKSPQTVAAVVGGFHTEWMTRELKTRGKTYVVLSPQVTQSGYEGLYQRGMEQTISALRVR